MSGTWHGEAGDLTRWLTLIRFRAGSAGEAAFMTGLERNADIVFSASYAPLLGVRISTCIGFFWKVLIRRLQHVAGTQWVSDTAPFNMTITVF